MKRLKGAPTPVELVSASARPSGRSLPETLKSYGSARDGRWPGSWRGRLSAGLGAFGNGSALAFLARAGRTEQSGSGSTPRLGVLKSKTLVRSPQTARRHGLICGSITPKRVSRNRITEVWSNTCELTKPPLVQGE